MDKPQDMKDQLRSMRLAIDYLEDKVFLLEKTQKKLKDSLQILSDLDNRMFDLEQDIPKIKTEIASLRKSVEKLHRFHKPL